MSVKEHQNGLLVCLSTCLILLTHCGEDLSALGKACKDTSECASLDNGICRVKGYCSRACETHSDCGCLEEIGSKELEKGVCVFVCAMEPSTSRKFCHKWCQGKNDPRCEPQMKCQVYYSVGINVCL